MTATFRQRVGGALIMLIGAASLASSAEVTISGTVVDETGNPVSGARVSVSRPQFAATLASATCDPAGVFSLELPNSGDYKLRIQREGFFQLLEQQVRVKASTVIQVRLTHLKELAESMDVSYSPPILDPEQTSEIKPLDGQSILNLPYAASQDYREALPLMPGAVKDNNGDIHFNGSLVNETGYRLDGFDVADTASGGLAAHLSVDTVQEVEWSAARMSAEDQSPAGTVAINTEMGNDQWRFGATNPIPSFDTSGGLHPGHWSPRFMTSGPLIKGKLWFHTAFDPSYIADTITGLPNGQNRTESFTGSDLTRFQWNVSSWQTLTASLLYNRSNLWHDGLSVLNPLETTTNQRLSLMMGTIKDQFIVNGNLIQAGVADTTGYSRSSPVGSEPYVITPFGSSGNFFRDQASVTSRQEGVFNAAFKPLHHAGTHQLLVGSGVENNSLTQSIVRHALSVVGADGSVVRAITFEGSPVQAARDTEAYGYIVDHWRPWSDLAFDIGVRTQWNRVTGGNPPAPRLGAAWAPKQLHGVKLSAGWGVYYDTIPLATLALGEDQASLTTFSNSALAESIGALPAVPLESRYVLDARTLRAPEFTLASISAERMLFRNFFSRVTFSSRQGSRGLGFQQDLVTPALNEYIADNSLRTSYKASEVTLRRTFRKNYQLQGSYTHSAARSSAVIPYTVENPLLTPQAAGPQPWDTPNRIVLWAWAPVQSGWFPRLAQPLIGQTDFEFLGEYHTGFPFSAITENGYLAGAPDSRRFPNYLSVNVALERQFHFRGHLWAARMGMVNVLNRANPNVVNNDIDSPQFLFFGRGQARAFNFRLRFLGKK